MIRRWLQLRSTRKFLTNRLAVFALCIVVGYLLVAGLTSLFGFITLDDTFERVGPKTMPGLFQTQLPEKRVEDSEYTLSQVERALKRSDPVAAVREIRFGNLRVRDASTSQLQAIVDDGWRIYDQLSDSPDLNADPAALPKIEELEQVTASLFKPLEGLQQWQQSFALSLGTDTQGRSIAKRAIFSIEIAIKIGVVVAFFSVLIGAILGTAAGYYGGWVDHCVTWVFTTFSSIPSLVLLVLLAYMFTGSVVEGTLIPMYIAFSATYWIGPCRVIRGETMKFARVGICASRNGTRFQPTLHHAQAHFAERIAPDADQLLAVIYCRYQR